MRKKMKKGFTLIELLIVIAIIGILAGVVLVSTSSARDKANLAAFKSEVSGAIPGLMIECDTHVLYNANSMVETSHHDNGIIVRGASNTVCGPEGNGNFMVNVVAKKDEIKSKCGTASIQPTGVTFTNAGNCF